MHEFVGVLDKYVFLDNRTTLINKGMEGFRHVTQVICSTITNTRFCIADKKKVHKM